MATAEHNAHVLQQQAEALQDAGKEERELLEMLLENLDDDRARDKDDEENGFFGFLFYDFIVEESVWI